MDLATSAVLAFDSGQAIVHCGFDQPHTERLVITGDDGVLEVPGLPFTTGIGRATELIVDGESFAYPPCDPYQLMVEEVCAVVEGRSGWTMPTSDSRAVAAVIDAVRASANHDVRAASVRSRSCRSQGSP